MSIRADESKPKRLADLAKLEQFLKDGFKPGDFIAILDWYKWMADIGLGHSARQRLSDLRADFGLQMDYDKGKRGYTFEGFLKSGQLVLFREVA